MDEKKYHLAIIMFSIANLAMGIYSGLYDPSFNNYLSQVHHVGEVVRGGLEFPRELPGFLVVFIFTGLLFLKDSIIAMLAALLVGLSLWGQGFLSPNLTMAVIWMFTWSAGAHLCMVMRSSMALRLAETGQAGALLGRIGALEAGGILLGSLLVYFGVSIFHISFGAIFGLAGGCALIAAVCLRTIDPAPIKRPPHYLVFKRRYTLFYILNILFGARKQIFLTFAPWVLIRLFGLGVDKFALLGLVGTSIGLVFRPLLGNAIDCWGERIIILCESVLLILVCVLYGFAPGWFPPATALLLIMACFVVDQVLFAASMARVTYLNRIVEHQDDVGPTISMGVTLDHVVSMSVPVGGGLLWATYGFQWVFVVAAAIAVMNLVASLYIPALTSPSGHPLQKSA